jgi:hypothetical protein
MKQKKKKLNKNYSIMASQKSPLILILHKDKSLPILTQNNLYKVSKIIMKIIKCKKKIIILFKSPGLNLQKLSDQITINFYPKKKLKMKMNNKNVTLMMILIINISW